MILFASFIAATWLLVGGFVIERLTPRGSSARHHAVYAAVLVASAGLLLVEVSRILAD